MVLSTGNLLRLGASARVVEGLMCQGRAEVLNKGGCGEVDVQFFLEPIDGLGFEFSRVGLQSGGYCNACKEQRPC